MNKKQKKIRLKKLNNLRKENIKKKWGRCTQLKYCPCGRIVNGDIQTGKGKYWGGKVICQECVKVLNSRDSNPGNFPKERKDEFEVNDYLKELYNFGGLFGTFYGKI
jgi:hypothetical protein